MLSLVQGGAANIPLWMEALDGNSSDKTNFQETVRRVQAFTQSIHGIPDGLCFVVDAAFYVPEQLAELNNVFWITRVPAQLKEVKILLHKPAHELTCEGFDANYRGSVYETVLYGILAIRLFNVRTMQSRRSLNHSNTTKFTMRFCLLNAMQGKVAQNLELKKQ